MFCIPFQVALTTVLLQCPSIKWILRVTRHHYQHHHPHCFQQSFDVRLPTLWSFHEHFENNWVLKSELWSDCPDFHLGWQFIVFLCSCFFPLSVQSSTCSTLGPASLHVPVLSFCTDFVGELWSFCTESEYLHQSIISGVLRAIFNCERIELSLIGRSSVTLCFHIFKTASTF